MSAVHAPLYGKLSGHVCGKPPRLTGAVRCCSSRSKDWTCSKCLAITKKRRTKKS